MLGRHDEIALVLAVLVVHDDHHAPGAQLGQHFPHRVERGGRRARVRFTGKGQDL